MKAILDGAALIAGVVLTTVLANLLMKSKIDALSLIGKVLGFAMYLVGFVTLAVGLLMVVVGVATITWDWFRGRSKNA